MAFRHFAIMSAVSSEHGVSDVPMQLSSLAVIFAVSTCLSLLVWFCGDKLDRVRGDLFSIRGLLLMLALCIFVGVAATSFLLIFIAGFGALL